MKTAPVRKLPRFYIINPVTDRRLEPRFESREDVVIRFDESGRTYPAVAHDIWRRGMKLECSVQLPVGAGVQIAFPNVPDHIRCFGRVVWCRAKEKSKDFENGVAIDAWHGIVEGEDSWKKFRGLKLKADRRAKQR